MLVASIDIINGKAVQLRQGKEFVLEADTTPLDLARNFNRFGEVAVIDLDAAMGKGDNRALIKQICQVCDARVGGGIRDVETAQEYLRAGASKVIIGTKAEPELLKQLPSNKVMVALDHKNGKVVDKGWTNSTNETVQERAKRLAPYCDGFLSTYVEAEGGLGGMDIEAVKQLRDSLEKPLTVAGGVANTEEVIELSLNGIDVQVGMALYTGRIDLAKAIIDCLKFGSDGLIPTVVQDQNQKLLMLAYSSKDSLELALTNGKGIYFSRSRSELWEKGATSGHTQTLLSCRTDCDRDALVFTVMQEGVACHDGSYSCFTRNQSVPGFSLPVLFDKIAERKRDFPEKSYTTKLLKDRKLLLEKISEECDEVMNYTSRENLQWEIADLLYFLSVLAVDEGLSWKQIEGELSGRAK